MVRRLILLEVKPALFCNVVRGVILVSAYKITAEKGVITCDFHTHLNSALIQSILSLVDLVDGNRWFE